MSFDLSFDEMEYLRCVALHVTFIAQFAVCLKRVIFVRVCVCVYGKDLIKGHKLFCYVSDLKELNWF